MASAWGRARLFPHWCEMAEVSVPLLEKGEGRCGVAGQRGGEQHQSQDDCFHDSVKQGTT